ncbi:A24 family peptidase [Paenibacillus abyssi]|uniref:Prepilin type IV endopeptidase peptidase domain-containing protein n=1 Tax=Paenibacillus abyssi TaxID=1340531 RepID=A0A917FQW3_9BACL|nr:prepilin peptidase [Paenibacillus abyssi]GGG00584.1 hypothetical protein GCM10010916_17170 [Paenibacillus abyssi]
MWPNVILIGVLMVCVVTDLRERKIYNAIVFPSLLTAWFGHWTTGGWSALSMSLTGFLTGFCILLIPYLLGGIGAGDVKLLALVGALKGALFVLATSFYMALIGAAMALFILIVRKRSRSALHACVMYLYGLKYGLKFPFYGLKGSVTATCPYGIAIAGGGMMVLLGKGWGIG